MPITSPWRDVHIPDVDIWTFFMEDGHFPREYPDDHELFIDCDTNRSWTYSQIQSSSIQLGQALQHHLSWRKGDVLALYTPNDVDIPVVNLGLHYAGGVATPANPTYTVDELARQLTDSGARVLVTIRGLLGNACKAADKVGLPRGNILLLGEGRDEGGEFRHWRDLEGGGGGRGKVGVDAARDLAFLVYSSGTTGLPKGVQLTHRNIIANALQMHKADIRTLTHDLDRQIGIVPFFHIYGLSVVINTTLSSGAPCIVMPKFDLEKMCQIVAQHSITCLYVPPPIILALSKHPLIDKYDFSSMRYINSGAAPLSRELVVGVWERLKVGVKQGYGLSETSPVANTQLADEWWRYQGSVGRLVPGMEAKIVDLEGREVPRGQTGEILYKGPNVFNGYWKRLELNKETFTPDGWYHTGDIGYACPKGHFYITDRMKELIKYKGFQVPPAELEDKLLGHKDITDVGVIGVWDPEHHTEVPRAYVVLRAGVKPSDTLARDIVAWLDGKVAPPKKLRGGVRFIEEIPKSQAGKILRRVLKDRAKEEEAKGVRSKL